MSKHSLNCYSRDELRSMLKFNESQIDNHNQRIKNNLANIEKIKLENSKLYDAVKVDKKNCAAIRRELALRGV